MPFPGLSSLRDRFTYNINPFSSIPRAIVSYGNTGKIKIDIFNHIYIFMFIYIYVYIYKSSNWFQSVDSL